MKQLFLFTIGPVQGFIAQARKTRDLYAGSKMLTELTWNAMAEFKAQGGELIYPEVQNLGDFALEKENLPNRFVGSIETEADLRTVGQAIEARVREVFTTKGFDSLREAQGAKPLGFEEQLANFLDIHWAFSPWQGGYEQDYNKLEQLGGAIKNLRAFDQLAERGRKCSLCGERNVLFVKSLEKERVQIKPDWGLLEFDQEAHLDIKAFNSNLATVRGYNIEESEGLCAVCLTKRFYQKRKIESFPATAIIALLKDMEGKEDKIEEYKKNFSKEFMTRAVLDRKTQGFEAEVVRDFDDQFLFEEGLTKNSVPDEYQRKYAKNFLKKELKGLKTKYYALLMYDGDSMGKLMSGELLQKNDDHAKLDEFQKLVSETLGEFSIEAMNYLDGKGEDKIEKGRTVYAGGDDFMGLVNLHYLFDVMRELRQRFRRQVHDKIHSKFPLKSEFSFSAGITIAHYISPLSAVLDWTRKMEKKAKKVEGKNAFAIAVMKRSGEMHVAVSTWGDDLEVVEQWQKVCAGLENDFSDTYIRKLALGLEAFNKSSTSDHEAMFPAIASSELKRLLRRSCKIARKSSPKESAADYFQRAIRPFLDASEAILADNMKAAETSQNLFFSLDIINFIHRIIHAPKNETK